MAFGADTWQHAPEEVRSILLAPELPTANVGDGGWILLQEPVRYPPLADRAAPMLALAGVRIDPTTGANHAEPGYTRPVLLEIATGKTVPVNLPAEVRLLGGGWSPDGSRYLAIVRSPGRIGLMVGGTDGSLKDLGQTLVPMLGSGAQWVSSDRLLVKIAPSGRGPMPAPPVIPAGPLIRESSGAKATSTYEARNLLVTAYDDALFEHFGTSQLAFVGMDGKVTPVGTPGVYESVSTSPDGKYLLVERLVGPWSHRVGYSQFARKIEVWDAKSGKLVHTVAELPAAEQVPIHGVPTGPRSVRWRSTAPSSLVWIEALDGGDSRAKATKRDRVVQLPAPFKKAKGVFEAEHRVYGLSFGDNGLMLVTQDEEARRWVHVWTVNLDKGGAKPLFDLSENDRYADPGEPLYERLPSGHWVLDQDGDDLFYSGAGASPAGDRPFLDRRSLKTGAVTRLFRSNADRYENFVDFVGDDHQKLLIRRQSPDIVPNLHVATLGPAQPASAPGEPQRGLSDTPLTSFADPTPALRGITKQIVKFPRKDGVELSFTLYLPKGYTPGTKLPTILYAYPREFSDKATASQVSGSEKTFDRTLGPSHLFLLQSGYAILHNTTMPVLGDPETAYDSFVEQLVMSAEAAVDKAVEMGVTDRERVGVMGHSHGGLMTATLLAHSDLFRAGVARSGAYNHTIRPFGFQSERRTLWEARETYLKMAPVMFAPQINEPILLIHGAIDENPGTVPLQSERLYEAVRGTGGTARLVMLPFESHGYAALESVEHVLWEQLQWFDEHVKNAKPRK